MPQRAPAKEAAPTEQIENFGGGYNGYTDPQLTKPQQWLQAVNVISGAFGYIQRCRFANISGFGITGQPFTTMKYFALPGLSSYLLADRAGKLFSFDTVLGYFINQRFNPYVDPSGAGSSTLNGPWSRESLGNIMYEMNGQVKQAGRNANALTIEGFGLDAPDVTPQVSLFAGQSQNIISIARSNNIVTVNLGLPITTPAGGGNMINIQAVTDASFNGAFTVLSGFNTTTLTWFQLGQNASSSGGDATTGITKAVGRSYVIAWENANKSHVGAPSPATQYIQYNAQEGQLLLTEAGTITFTLSSATITGVGTFFTSAWIGRSLWIPSLASLGRITAVASATSMTLATPVGGGSGSTATWIIYDPQATHLRLYATADGQATYFRIQRNAWNPAATTALLAGLQWGDDATSEPPNFPFTTEVAQFNNVPPPVGRFLNEYQGRLLVYGVTGATQSFFYSNQESTSVGLPQESFAPLNQYTLPIANGQINGMLEFPGSLIVWSDKQDMYRLTGLLTDNSAATTPTAQGAQVSRLPYALGCASPFAADITPLGGIWVTPNAEIWLYTDKYAPRNIGRPVQDILNTIGPGFLNLVRVKYFHSMLRNWIAISIPANGSSFCNTVLILDLDLLASNGSPSYFTFDMATNSPSWFIIKPGPITAGAIQPRCDAIEVVYEQGGLVRLMTGSIDLLQDIDFRGLSFGNESQVPGATVTLHAWGNDSATVIKRPSFMRFNTNQDPSTLGPDGWTFATNGIDDDFYTFGSPLTLQHLPGVNDVATLCGNPSLFSGEAFRFSPSLFKVGGVNFVMGRRLQFQVNFPKITGRDYQFRSVQLGFGPVPPR